MIFMFSKTAFSCPTGCDEKYLPAFIALDKKIWDKGERISSPLDSLDIDKINQANITHPEWNIFIKKLRPKDTVHFFVTDERSRGMLLGMEGYAIIRKGKIIEIHPTMMY